MPEQMNRAWVGDHVYDALAQREAIVSDVQDDGTYHLRGVYAWYLRWTAPGAERLSVIVPRQERVKRERER